MIGGATGTPSRKLTGPGTPTPAPWISIAIAVRRAACRPGRGRRRGRRPGPAHVDRLATCVRETASSAVGDGDVDRGGADVDADEPQARGEPDDRGAAAAAEAASPCDSTSPSSVSRSSSTASFERESWTVSPSSARLIGPWSRSSAQQRGLVRVLRPDQDLPHGNPPLSVDLCDPGHKLLAGTLTPIGPVVEGVSSKLRRLMSKLRQSEAPVTHGVSVGPCAVPELPEVEALVEFLREHARRAGSSRGSTSPSLNVLKTFDPPPTALLRARRRRRAAPRQVPRRRGRRPAPGHAPVARPAGSAGRTRSRPTPVRPGGKNPLALRVHLDDGSGFDVTEAGTKKRLAVYLVRDLAEVERHRDGSAPIRWPTTSPATCSPRSSPSTRARRSRACCARSR